MEPLKTLFDNWITHEPIASLWVGVVAALIFGTDLIRPVDRETHHPWLPRLLEALAKALVFGSLLGVVYFLLNSNYTAFSKVYGSFTTGGSLSHQQWNEWYKQYGGLITQPDLTVSQWVEVQAQEAITSTNPTAPTLFRNIIAEQPLSQNTIVRFNGLVTITLADAENLSNSFNGYTLSATYEYDIVNSSSMETRTEFRFPLPLGEKLFQDLRVQQNGNDVATWLIKSQAIVWDEVQSPGQKSTISIHYKAHGMDGFVFEVPATREVNDFTLSLAVNHVENTGAFTVPENGGIQVEVQTVPPFKIHIWKIQRAILAPKMGVGVGQNWPYAPYHEMIVTGRVAPWAAVLFLALLGLTLIICGRPIQLGQITLLAGWFCIPFGIFMAGGVPLPGAIPPNQLAAYQVKLLAVWAIAPMLLTWFTLRNLPHPLRVLIVLWLAFFVAGFPWIGLQPNEQKRNASEGLVQAGMIAYTIVLALFVRVRSSLRKGTTIGSLPHE